MGRIQVDIGGLQAAGGQASSLGAEVTGLAGEARTVAGAGAGAPPATESALGALGAAWSAGTPILLWRARFLAINTNIRLLLVVVMLTSMVGMIGRVRMVVTGVRSLDAGFVFRLDQRAVFGGIEFG